MRGDAGVDDRDVRVDAVVDAVDVGEARLKGADARDAGRGRLGGDRDDLVGHDGLDARVGEEGSALSGVEPGREAAERVLEGAVGLGAFPLADGG